MDSNQETCVIIALFDNCIFRKCLCLTSDDVVPNLRHDKPEQLRRWLQSTKIEKMNLLWPFRCQYVTGAQVGFLGHARSSETVLFVQFFLNSRNFTKPYWTMSCTMCGQPQPVGTRG